MSRTVFISHSTKDPGDEPPEANPEFEAWKRRRCFFELREALAGRIAAEEGYEPWLDNRRLEAGDHWRDGIHEGLARADGAVILLSTEALESGWVLKEATILTWMQAIGFPLVIIPVFLGVATEDVNNRLFGPLKIAEIQALKVVIDETGTMDHDLVMAKASEITDKLTTKLPQLPTRKARAPFEVWAGAVRQHLPIDNDILMEAVMAQLGLLGDVDVGSRKVLEALGRPDWASARAERDVGCYVARELLLSRADGVLDAVVPLRDAPMQWKPFVRTLTPTWVHADTAKHAAMAAAHDPGRRVLVINASNPRTGRAIVDRAHCRTIAHWQLFAPDEPTDPASPEEVAGYYRTKVAERIRLNELPDKATPTEPVYVVIGSRVAAYEPFLAALLADPALQPVTFIVMAGSESERVRLELNAEAISPLLPDDADADFSMFVSNLEGLGR